MATLCWMKMVIRYLLISLFLLISGNAWAQNPVGTCPSGVSSSFPGCYPFIQGGVLAPTDGVAVIQAGVTPLSRIASIAQLLQAVGTTFPSITVSGLSTLTGGVLTNSIDSIGTTLTIGPTNATYGGTSTFTGTMAVLAAATFSNGLTVTGTTALASNVTNFGRGTTFTWSGSSLDPTKFGLYANNNCAGTTSIVEVPCVGYVAAPAMNMQALSGVVDGLFVAVNTGGVSAASEGWNAGSFSLSEQSPTNDLAGGGAGVFNALQLTNCATQNLGGTGTAPQLSFGQTWGTDINVVLTSGATDRYLMHGAEIDMRAQAGSSVTRKIGLAIYSSSGDVVRGSDWDAAESFSGSWVNGITWGGWPHTWTSVANSTLINATYSQDHLTNNTSNIFIDGLEPTFTTAFLRSNGFLVDGSGDINAGTCWWNITSTGNNIDCSDSIVTTLTLDAPGTNYIVGDPLYYGANGRTSVSTVEVESAAVRAGGSGGTDGASVTVTGTSGIFSVAFQANVVVSGGTITSVNSITTKGVYTAGIPVSGTIFYSAVSGDGLSGASLNIVPGVQSITGNDRPATALSPPCTTGCATTTWGRTSGSGATVTAAWTARTTVGIGTTSATAINEGNVSSTTTIAGSVKMPDLPTTCTGHSGFIAAVSNTLTLCP